MRTMTNEEMFRLSKEAEKQIRGAYLELAAQIEFLEGYNEMAKPVTREHVGLDHEYWSEAARQFAAVEHARHRYMEGEYQSAIDALPEF